MSRKKYRYTRGTQIAELLEIGLTDEEPDIGFAARDLFHMMIPHSASEAREWTRTNGDVRVMIQAGSDGLPYGSYPRLLLVWMVTEAMRQKDPTLVLGSSLSDFMAQLGLAATGGRWGTITSLRDQLRRLLTSRIIATKDRPDQDKGATMEVASDWDLWWAPQDPDQVSLWESRITLGKNFYAQIVNRPFPIDMRVLRAIKKSPLGIDLYTWLTYRVSYLKEPVAISWKQLHSQFGAEYADDKSGLDGFTRAAKRELKKIKHAWTELDYETPRGRIILKPSPPSVKRLPPSPKKGSG